MRKIIFIYLISAVHYVTAQTVTIPDNGCPINTLSTDPNNYQNSSDPNGSRLWNWMTEDFSVYYTADGQGTTGFLATLRSPFYALVSNSNILHFTDPVNKDYKPSEGWELMARNFGTSTQGVANPYFILYNRFTGVIRVFVNIRNTGNQAVNAATLAMRFAPNSYKTALFNNLGTITNAVNNFDANAKNYITNNYVNSGVNDNYYWITGDYNTMYDPCTCGIASDLRVTASTLSNAEIVLNINGTETTLLNNTNSSNIFEERNIFTTIKQYADFGNTLVNDAQGLFTSANEAFDNGVALQDNAQEFINNNEPFFGEITTQTIARQVGRLLFEVPRVNSWLKFASTLITVVKKTGDGFEALSAEEKLAKLASVNVSTKTTKLKATGGISQSIPVSDEYIGLPGSNLTGVADFRKPVYNNSLGIFNLLKQPEVKITKYNAPSPLYYQVGESPNAYLEDNSVIDVFTPIYSVQVTEELIPIVNPASGLKLISLESRLEFVNREAPQNKLKGPMVPGQLMTLTDFGFQDANIEDRLDYYSDHGYSLLMFDKNAPQNNKWDRSLFATPTLSQGCFMNTSLFTFSTVEDIVVKVTAVMEPINANPNSEVENVVVVYTYPAKITNVTSPLKYEINQAVQSNGTVIVQELGANSPPFGITIPNYTYSPIMGVSGDNELDNMTIDQDIFVIGNIVIGENVKINPGTHTIKATGNVYFEKSLINSGITSFPIDYTQYNYTFIAGNEIIVNPEVIINPETTLSIDQSLALTCTYPTPVLATNTEVKSFCSSSTYSNLMQKGKTELSEEEENVTHNTIESTVFDAQLFPNPTTGNVNISLSNKVTSIHVIISEISGKKLQELNFSNTQSAQLNLSGYAQGAYLITVVTEEGSVTKQLMKR